MGFFDIKIKIQWYYMKMKEKLYSSVFPSEHNNGTPLLIQASGAIIMVGLAFAVFALANIHGFVVKNYAGDNYAAVVAAVLLDQTNEQRADLDLPYLTPSAELTASAQLKANDMAQEGYFAHVSPSGVTPWQWFEQAGYQFSYAGENLAVNFRDSGSVTNAWMNSPTHRENIVNQNFAEIGIATSVGRYKGDRSTFVAQHFGTPYNRIDNSFSINSDSFLDPTDQDGMSGDQALRDANEFLAAVNRVGLTDRLMVQPDRIYLVLFGLMLLVISVIGVNAYVKSDSRAQQNEILTYAGLSALVIIALGLASLAMLDSQVIAGVKFITF